MRRHLTRFFCIFALVLFAASIVKAEYRVYELGLVYAPGEKEVVLLSTLDHMQYPTYYQLTSTQTTRIISHWRCNGDTSQFQQYCANPSTLNPTAPQNPLDPAAPSAPAAAPQT